MGTNQTILSGIKDDQRILYLNTILLGLFVRVIKLFDLKLDGIFYLFIYTP